MLTLATLVKEGLLRSWQPTGGRMAIRGFDYSRSWQQARDALPGVPLGHRISWCDEETLIDAVAGEVDAAIPDIDLAAMDLSVRGGLDGLVESFVAGWPRVKLIRKQGFGMEPPFRRMRPPHEGVVEMRTEHTRTFGFFVREAVFVAHRLDLATHTHANRGLYVQYGNDVSKLLKRIAPTDKDESSDVELLIGG